MSFLKEIQRRRTFGIISHPDAGKTTLTEKLLLFGGAIQEAGAVKSNKIKKGATSDFMEIERQRGISVATSVLAFEYDGIKINILDTPGHKDFAEDTFRTLTAVDSVIVVIDVAKGVEEQTEKLVEETIEVSDLTSPKLDELIGANAAKTLREEIELVEGIYPTFDKEEYLAGKQQPVFFGSALNNFGVRELLDCFVEIAPKPRPKQSEERLVKPDEKKFTGFVFKIHANMDPNHRNRLAFVKVVSGEFKRNAPYLHVRHNKKVKFSSPNAFFAEKKEIVDTSYPGDIVGLQDTGTFKIGDTLTEGEILNYKGVPSFSPEHFRYINNADPLKSKQLFKGIDQLMDEGVAQLFTLELNGRKVIGTVGALQYEVIQYRLEHEYGAKCTYENLNVYKACWVDPKNSKTDEYKEFVRVKQRFLAKDKQNQLVFLADSSFSLQMTQQKYPNVKFHFTSEFD